MQNNYYFLRQVSASLQTQLLGFQLMEAFSQVKDELVLFFYSQEKKQEFYIRVSLSPSFTCLSFPASFARAKQNSVDLFEEIIGEEVVNIRQYLNERCFSIHFGNQHALLFKMYGQMANVLLLVQHSDESTTAAAKTQTIALFNNNLDKDWATALESLDRPIDQHFTAFEINGLQKTFPTFDKQIKAQITSLESTPSQNDTWEKVQKILAYFESPTYYLLQEDNQISFSLFPAPDAETFTNPIDAVNQFYYLYISKFQLLKEKHDILKKLEREKEKLSLYLTKSEEKLVALALENRYEEIANILMANLHLIDEKFTKITLYDFYHNKDLSIKLKENLSPQKNAEAYYRKGKNQKIEIQTLTENATKKEASLKEIEKHIGEIQEMNNLRELRKYLKNNSLDEEGEERESSPFRRYDWEGFEILVGKNAKNNDLLIQKYAFKEDLWLHARDVSGSHVVVKYKAGKPFPSTVIMRAAELAAWFSKRKNDSLCPVIYTPKKYVRKKKGAAEGAVMVEKEQVIMVEPKG